MKTFAICLRGRTSTLLTFAGLFILAWSGLYAKAPLPAPVLAGQPVLEEEYTFYMEQLRTEVASRFMREHGVEQSEAFWKTPIGGKSPENLLQEATLRAIARHRVLLQLGVESGILKKVLRYPELVSLFHVENQRRRAMHERGEVFYGPVRYRQDVWFTVWFEQLARGLQKHMRESLPGDGDRTAQEAAAAQALELEVTTRVERLLGGLSEMKSAETADKGT